MRIASLIVVAILSLALFAMAQSALENGRHFLKENAAKPGIKTTSSGIQYKVLSESSGKSPKATDIVVVNCRGALINRKEFDSSHKSGRRSR
jgi:FKBP-type peptidyl-prolyl cis-trans isomerase FklB